MEAWDRFSLVVWVILFTRTIAFRGHWEGYLWTPHLHADTWYRLTPHVGYIPYKQLPVIWTGELLLATITVLMVQENQLILTAQYIRLFLTRLWWMLFLELGASWYLTILLPLLAISIDITLYITHSIFSPLPLLTIWCFYMNMHAWCIAVKPVTRIQYKARTSRILSTPLHV